MIIIWNWQNNISVPFNNLCPAHETEMRLSGKLIDVLYQDFLDQLNNVKERLALGFELGYPQSDDEHPLLGAVTADDVARYLHGI